VQQEFETRGIDAAAGLRLLDFFSALASLDEAAEIAVNEDPAQKRKALNAAILGRLVEFVGADELGARGVDELRRILEFAEAEGCGARIEIDPSLARGLSYYTGAIMEINVKDLPGSLGGGGRYDNLVGMFSGESVPACGFSLGLERIIVVMTEREMFPADLARAPAEVMVSIWNEESIADAVLLAQELRRAGLRVDLYPEADKLGKQLKYAAARGIDFVAVIGADERARNEVSIKDMRSGEQRTVKRADVAANIPRLPERD
jgi:histidyl-tRNA synthetase